MFITSILDCFSLLNISLFLVFHIWCTVTVKATLLSWRTNELVLLRLISQLASSFQFPLFLWTRHNCWTLLHLLPVNSHSTNRGSNVSSFLQKTHWVETCFTSQLLNLSFVVSLCLQHSYNIKAYPSIYPIPIPSLAIPPSFLILAPFWLISL